VESFGNFCDRAKSRGLRVDLEFIPFWGIRDLTTAWHIVRTADRENSGVLVDTWHMQKGSTDFTHDIALLQTIPGERLVSVRLCDARIEPQAGTLLDEIIEVGRGFPGEGELAIDLMLGIILGKGGLRDVGPEILSPSLASLAPTEIGARAGNSTRQAIARAKAAQLLN
jgi:sugar phosphate isomerase/epimerase